MYNILGVQQSIQYPISTPVTTSTQSLLSSDQQHHSMLPGKWIIQLLHLFISDLLFTVGINSPLFEMMVSQMVLDPNSKGNCRISIGNHTYLSATKE